MMPCFLCGTQGHLASQCPNKHCNNCGLPGHLYHSCTERAYWHKQCHRCSMTGHFFDVSKTSCWSVYLCYYYCPPPPSLRSSVTAVDGRSASILTAGGVYFSPFHLFPFIKQVPTLSVLLHPHPPPRSTSFTQRLSLFFSPYRCGKG